jgi:hypothetical protein
MLVYGSFTLYLSACLFQLSLLFLLPAAAGGLVLFESFLDVPVDALHTQKST